MKKPTPKQTVLAVSTPDGVFTATYSGTGLARLAFPATGKSTQTIPKPGAPVPAQVRQWHALTTRAVQAVLAGQPHGKLPPLDLSRGTEFQQFVWAELMTIPAGRTRTYGEVAGLVGRPRAVRAVGQACGANPVPLLVPCHRVVAAGGGLGGFSGGLHWKQDLLARERGS
jgi:O-6-methylguanine DNA methyltransferase